MNGYLLDTNTVSILWYVLHPEHEYSQNFFRKHLSVSYLAIYYSPGRNRILTEDNHKDRYC